MTKAPIDFPDDDEEFLEEDTSYNFRQLMDMLLANKDIILTIPSDQEEALRSGLITRKSKDNKMAMRKGLLPMDDVLSFISYPAKNKQTGEILAGQTCLRIKLAAKKSVNILSIEIPDDSF